MTNRTTFTAVELKDQALSALEEVIEQAEAGKVQQSQSLRFTLAYLWTYSGQPKGHYDNFWRAVKQNDVATLQTSLEGIRHTVNAGYDEGSTMRHPWRDNILGQQNGGSEDGR